MRRTIGWCTAVVILATVGSGSGAALDQKVVSANAKWLIHADIDSLKSGKFGAALFNYLQTGPLAGVKTQLKTTLGVELDFDKVTAITAYGSDFESNENNDGVVLVNSGQNLKTALDSLTESPQENVKVTKTTTDGLDLYAIAENMFLTQLSGNLLVASRTSGSIVKAKDVLAGKEANLSTQDRFTGYTRPDKPILLLMAEEFQQQKAISGPLEMLKQAEGMQLSLAEVGEKVQLELTLKTPNKEASDQISQVVNGLLALTKMNQQDADLMQLLNSALVKSTDRLVSISFSYPTERALAKLAGQPKAE